MADELAGKRVAILVETGFEEVEMTAPRRALNEAGAETVLVSPQPSDGRRRKPLKIKTIIAAACAALAISTTGPVSAQDGETETVTKNFEAAIPNIPGTSLLAVEVDYAPGAASPSHTHAKSAFIYAYVISGAIESACCTQRHAPCSSH